MAGAVCSYSPMYVTPSAPPRAFSELHRIVKPGGRLVSAFDAGDGQVRRAGGATQLGVEFDLYFLSPAEMQRRAVDAGFTSVFCGGRPAEPEETSPQGNVLARRS